MIRQALLASLLFACLLIGNTQATAHPLAPALLEIDQQQGTMYNVLWRLSSVQMKGIAPKPVLPENCTRTTEISMHPEPGLAVASRWEISCAPAGLQHQVIRIQGLDRNPINVVLKVRTANGEWIQALLDGDQPEFQVPAPEEGSTVFVRYLELGISHLVFGPDHLLFLLALILLVGMRKKLIWTLTAFTLGHSITLTLASLGLISANAALMELGIALSLIVAARELLAKAPSIIGRHPSSMAALFGLLHGMGFAGALADIGLPQNDLLPALLAFNLGIELAQLGIVFLLYLGLLAIRANLSASKTRTIRLMPAYGIGALAAMWCIERTFTVLL